MSAMTNTAPEFKVPWVCESEANWERHFAKPHAQLYVNAYGVVLAFGGPEEGGWWYDAGDPLASVPVANREQAIEALRTLHGKLAEQYAPDNRWQSSGSTPDLSLCVEDHFAQPYPAERPHYE